MKNKKGNENVDLIKQAEAVFKDNFPMQTCFERAIFFSWYCGIADCKYCYMSTQREKIEAAKGKGQMARRTDASLIAEALLCKKLGWEIGFLSGGHNAYDKEDFLELLRKLHVATGEKFWLNIGPLSKDEFELFLPYAKGYVASIETVNKRLHDFVCPSKPIAPFEKSLKIARDLGLKTGMTIILGLGETIEDFPLLKEFISNHKIDKIHFYSLNPQKGTVFENSEPITKEYQAEWIAMTRIAFPKIDIQCGIWLDKVENIELLLRAGANSISKFPALRYFNSKYAKEVERQAKNAGREFIGTLTKMPDFGENELNHSRFSQELSEEIVKKAKQYLKRMNQKR
ncbi:MAG: radical SAM protein [Nanoarchaeota archaeon]|nr:radical SAM protein [Nanoarchaeota archaeon]